MAIKKGSNLHSITYKRVKKKNSVLAAAKIHILSVKLDIQWLTDRKTEREDVDEKSSALIGYTLSIRGFKKMSGDIAQNNLVRFISIAKKKDGLFANFKVRGIKGGATLTSTISVDLNQANVHPGDNLEHIIEACGRIAVRMCETKLQFEGLSQN